MLEGQRPPITGDGGETRGFTYVDDVVKGNLLALTSPCAAGQAINIGSGTSTSIRKLVEVLNELLGTQLPPQYVPPRPGDIRLDPAMGGGSVWDLGSYCVSFARTVLQAQPVEVHAVEVTGPTGIDMSFSGHLRFPKGTFFHFFSSFASFTQVDADLLGTAGYLHLDLPWVNRENQPATVRLVSEAGVKESSTFGDGLDNRRTERKVFADVNAYQDEVESMAATVLDGADPVVTLEDSRANVAAITALNRSAREGRPVEL